jgi:hypothetical protein
VNTRATLGVFAKGIALFCLIAIGIVGLSVAWIALIFSVDASPGHEFGAKMQAVLIAIGTVAVVGTGLYLMFRERTPGSDSANEGTPVNATQCGLCGKVFPSHYYLQDAGPSGRNCRGPYPRTPNNRLQAALGGLGGVGPAGWAYAHPRLNRSVRRT